MRNWIKLCETASPANTVRDSLFVFGEQIGVTVDIAIHTDTEISLENLFVPEERRREGLAKKFMQTLCTLCDQYGVTCWVYPEPYEGNIERDELRWFYKDHGFYPDDDNEGYSVRRP